MLMVNNTKKHFVVRSMDKYGKKQQIATLLLVIVLTLSLFGVLWYTKDKDQKMTSKAASWTTAYVPSINTGGEYFSLKRISVCVARNKGGELVYSKVNFNRGNIKVEPIVYIKYNNGSYYEKVSTNKWQGMQNITFKIPINKSVPKKDRNIIMYGAGSSTGRDGFLTVPETKLDLTFVRASC